MTDRWLKRWALPASALALAVTLSACENRPELGQQQSTTTLVVSESWMQSAADDVDVRGRLEKLQRAIKKLREETGTGWVGQQDDVTGYLGQLSGGSWVGTPSDFMDTYGPDLFGIDSRPLRLGPPDSSTVEGMTSIRASQVLGEVPVLDAVLQLTSRNGSSTDGRLTEVRGRVFPGLTVDTQPQVGRKRAVAAAEERSGGRADGEPRLVVLPDGAGILAWEVSVVEGDGAFVGVGFYYIDAVTGELITVRPGSAELGAPLPGANATSVTPSPQRSAQSVEPDPNTVEVTGVDPTGKPVSGQGVRTDRGIELRDTTTPAWDARTQRGEISTYDASGVRNDSQLPGELVVSSGAEVGDAEAIAAHSYSRKVIDYFTSLGRNSWDDTGASAVGSVHYGPPDFCNAFFAWSLNPPQMVFGPPCQTETATTNSFVEIDVTGHEITHGVTRTSANLIYAGQSGALNESFSDYFGNVIGDRVNGTDSAALGEGLCAGIATPNSYCEQNPDGSKSLRYMLNGTDFDDYLRILNPGLRLNALELATQDQGGVHLNSAIWNNALWSIRMQLARIDGQTAIASPLAQAFDKAVYGALATRITPTAGFIEARAAVEQVIIDSGLDPTVLRVAREVFDANKICVGCPTTGKLAGDPVTATPQAQLDPSVSGDLVTWLDMSAGEYIGSADSVRVGSGSTPSTGAGNVLDVALAGESVVVIDGGDQVMRYEESGSSSLLDRGRGDLMLRGLVGSDAGAAWAPSGARLAFVDPAGKVSNTDVPNLAGDELISVGTGGGTVAGGTKGGKVVLWRPGQGVRQLGTLPGMIATVANHGDNVLATFCTQEVPGRSVPTCGVRLFTADGRSYTVSDKGTVLGAAMSEEYAVWPEAIGTATSDVTPGGTSYPDTDLYLLSLRTGKIYSVLQEGGQQGFPAISGRRLVWQDSTFGGDDILTAELPPGL